MGRWTDYETNSVPDDGDDLMAYNMAQKKNKRITLKAIWNWMLDKLTNAVIESLQTNDRTVVGAINELKSRIDALDSTEPEETYSIALYLSNCTSSNTATTIKKGEPYTTTITANSGYKISNVVCRMGGIQQKVESGDYSRVITLASVTGDISITVVTAKE